MNKQVLDGILKQLSQPRTTKPLSKVALKEKRLIKEKENATVLVAKLRVLKKRHRFTNVQIGRLINKDSQVIAHWISGRKLPSLESCRRIELILP